METSTKIEWNEMKLKKKNTWMKQNYTLSHFENVMLHISFPFLYKRLGFKVFQSWIKLYKVGAEASSIDLFCLLYKQWHDRRARTPPISTGALERGI